MKSLSDPIGNRTSDLRDINMLQIDSGSSARAKHRPFIVSNNIQRIMNESEKYFKKAYWGVRINSPFQIFSIYLQFI
jgi:hypothetical protein